MDKKREDLLQTVTQRLMSLMRHVRHPGPPPEPALSPPQVHLMFTIGRKKTEGLSMKELAELSRITPGAVTQFVDGLVERGLVARESDPNDRRIVRLKLTELAKNQFEKFRKEHLVSMSRIFEALNDDEIKQLIALFTKMDTYHETKEHTID
ncbi:MAG: MarR family transcriptional regulator [Dehalococcoidales bacterium]|nr:MarR family transcriptional regulator [Dehalococcoidales bacterium]